MAAPPSVASTQQSTPFARSAWVGWSLVGYLVCLVSVFWPLYVAWFTQRLPLVQVAVTVALWLPFYPPALLYTLVMSLLGGGLMGIVLTVRLHVRRMHALTILAKAILACLIGWTVANTGTFVLASLLSVMNITPPGAYGLGVLGGGMGGLALATTLRPIQPARHHYATALGLGWGLGWLTVYVWGAWIFWRQGNIIGDLLPFWMLSAAFYARGKL